MDLSEQQLEEIVKYGTTDFMNSAIKGKSIDQETINKLFVRSLVSGRNDMFNYFLKDSTPKADINSLRCTPIIGKEAKPCIEDYLTTKDFNIGEPTFKECEDASISTYNRQAGAHKIIHQIVREYPGMLKAINIPVIAAHFGDKKTLEDVLKNPGKYCDINTSMCTRPTNVLKIAVDSGDTQLFKNVLDHPKIKPGDYSIGLNNPIMSNKGLQHTTVLLSTLYQKKHTINSKDLEELLGPSLAFFANNAKTQTVKDFVHILSKIVKQDPKLKEAATERLNALKELEPIGEPSQDKHDIVNNMLKAIETPNKESKLKPALHKIKSAMSSFTKLPSKVYNAIKNASKGGYERF